jgi:peptidoglycan hydrolase-like protein with peptidoglycan-binding domain
VRGFFYAQKGAHIMTWHLAPALDQLRAEVNALWPNRSKASDGTIGDAAHSARTSDHNPNGRGSVNAIDITASGIDVGKLINAAKAHPSVRYIIHNRKIMNRDIGSFRPRNYTGANPHTVHVHISLYQSATAENRTQSWGLANAKGGGVPGGGNTYTEVKGSTPLVKAYHKGEPVKRIQKAVGVGKVDGFYGPDTVAKVKAYQKAHGLSADGIVGPDTWAKINAGAKPPKTPAVPAFPWPSDHYIGPKSGPARSHSGVTGKDSTHVRTAQQQLLKRGWNGVGKADGLYGPKLAKVVRQFQKEKGLPVDGLIGPATWKALWTEPVT